jgi:tripartite ATP-independent transporter DctM subunit
MPLFLILVIVSGCLGVPVVFALIFGPSLDFLIQGKEALYSIMLQRSFAGMNQFSLLAVPLFILAGELMNRGGITERLVRFARALVGHFHGGLAQVTIVSSIFFAGLSGSAVADVSALGSILVPAMEKDGYPRDFAAAVTGAASLIGPIIPPSIIMIVYSYIMEVSTGALFAAGVVPGLLMGLTLMIMTSILARRRGYPRQPRASLREVGAAAKGSFLPIMTPFVILAGILFSVVSPTEAAIIAVAYALLLSLVVLRTMRLGELPAILGQAGLQAAVILLVIGSAAVFGWVLTITRMPQELASLILDVTRNPYVFLLICNIMLFIVGMFLDAGPAILILGPILGPTITQLGINPTHFAMVMCLNLTVGLATPPFGLVLFATSTIAGRPVGAIVRAMVPYLLVHVVVILIITYFPILSLALPRFFGLPV